MSDKDKGPSQTKPDESKHLFISIVALRKEYRPLQTGELERAVEAAYAIVLDPKRPQNSVHAVSAQSFFVKYGGTLLQVIDSAQPYSPNPEKDALSFTDAVWQKAWRQHRSWMSVDLIRADGKSGKDELDEYAVLAKLVAQFVDDNCLGAYVPGAAESDPDHFLPMGPGLRKQLLDWDKE